MVTDRQAGALAVIAVLAIARRAEFHQNSVHSFSLESFYHLYLSSLEHVHTHNHLTADLIENHITLLLRVT